MLEEKINLMFKYQKNNYNALEHIDNCYPYCDEIKFKDEFKRLGEKIRLFYIGETTYEDKVPSLESFENVLTASYNLKDVNFVYILTGTPKGIKLYIGIVKNIYKDADYSLEECSELLKSSIKANFPGTKFINKENTENYLSSEEQFQVCENIRKLNEFSFINGVPEFNTYNLENNQSKGDFQGIDRLINGMSGDEWALVLVAESVTKSEIIKEQEKIYAIYESLFPYSKNNIQVSNSSSIGKSDTESWGENDSEQIGTNESRNRELRDKESEAIGNTKSKSKGSNKGKSLGISDNITKGNTRTFEFSNKKIVNLLEYLDKRLLERYNLGINRGMFKTAIYTFASTNLTLNKLNNNFISIFQGENMRFSSMKVSKFKGLNDTERNLLKNYLLSLQTFKADLNSNDSVYAIMNSLPNYLERGKGSFGLSTYLSAREISLISGFPKKEVVGFSVAKGVDFGLNIPFNERGIEIGQMIHRGNILRNNKVFIDEEHLNKHVFITGVTGSGKTTTSQKILIESQLPFLVIEPAKTEYRKLFNHLSSDELFIYTLGSEDFPFRLNPFELIEGERLTAHIDLLKAAFIASFPMEAAMPYILEEAIYEIYKDKGWNTSTNKNIHKKCPWNSCGDLWPTMSDLLDKLDEVIKSKKFGLELESNYRGALIARFSNLIIGTKGKMLNCKLSTNLYKLIDKRVILELEELKDSREKSLMMALILSRLSVVMKKKHELDSSFKHITLIEEAHRLLSKIEAGDDGAKKIGVEIFADILAEIRKYGESLIIVDQIPNKLTPEVLKNTNTKIVHKLFAQDDKDVIGNTILLTDEQKNYLSLLKTGEAIMFSQDWNKALDVSIEKISGIENSFKWDSYILDAKSNKIRDVKILYPYLSEYIGDFREEDISNLMVLLEKIISDILSISEYLHRKAYDEAKEIQQQLIKKVNSQRNKDLIINIVSKTLLDKVRGESNETRQELLEELNKLFEEVDLKCERTLGKLFEKIRNAHG